MKIRLGLVTALLIFFILPGAIDAATLKASYPRLANYYLKWDLSEKEARELAKWDLLILDMEVQENSPEALRLIRSLNPEVIILAYITSQEIIDDIDLAAGNTGAFLRRELRSQIADNWWLKDPNGNKVVNWPGTYMLNLSNSGKTNYAGLHFNDYLPVFVADNIASSGLFDGVFYDNTWGDVSWINNGNLDLNNDGLKDSAKEADLAWSDGFYDLLTKTRELLGNDFIIVGNGRVFAGYQKLLNGMMLESFPSSWENGGTWSGSMVTYLNLPAVNRYPQLPIVNVNKKNETNYQAFRFGLTSTLLGDGFYSFDYDVTNHTQTWWYDEYNFNLGPAQSQAYNLLQPNSLTWQPGLWRRDFKYGSVIVNSTDKNQLQVFSKESFEKIKGTQDKVFNNGEKISYLKLNPQDGAILIKSTDNILNSVFVNGYFYRVFNSRGEQLRNGFFAFSSAYPASASVLVANGSKSEIQDVSLVASQGLIQLRKNGNQIASFYPYDNLFRKNLNLSAVLSDGFIETVAIGPTEGGGPQVRVFKANGQLLSSFFAYDSKLRGGVSVALADVDLDGQMEIVTGPGKGNEPLIKIFSLSGQLQHSFLAYDERFLGGVNLALGDVNGDGINEIVTVPGPGGGPQVRIFTPEGKVLGQFFAYDASYRAGLKISLSDLDNDGVLEVLVGAKNFY